VATSLHAIYGGLAFGKRTVKIEDNELLASALTLFGRL
jgi:hypothetical protein